MALLDPGTLDRRVTIEKPIAGVGFAGAGSGTWEHVRTVWASVQDQLPSRGERIAEGISVASRPARVRMYYRPDVTADMRFVMGDRVMQIVAGPAELGRRDGMEFMVVDYSTAGSGA